MKRVVTAFLVCSLCFCAYAQKMSPPEGEFAVLHTDRVIVTTGEEKRLNCSIVGSEDAAQMNCESHTGGGIPLVYHVALVVGSNHVGYLISCGGGLVRRIGCKALTAGQVLRGSIEDGKLSLYVDAKDRNYRIETSAYIGPIQATQSVDGSRTPSGDDANTAPAVKRAAQTEIPKSSMSQDDQPNSPSTSKVMVSSEPSGADIFVDGNFMGNTPSLLQLSTGSHTVRIEAKGQKSWSRDVRVTPGGKITIQATLSPE